MTVATESSGTQAATITTEHTLATTTTAKTRVLVVDLTNLVAGDTVELRIKSKVLTGGSALLAYFVTYVGPVAAPVVHSIPVPGTYGATFTLKQTTGTGRNYDFEIRTID
jgi:positive regulator of sigma E activity